jgi:hypothetical protein
MTDTRRFALICLLFWDAFLLAALAGLIPRVMAVGLGVAIFALWRLHCRGVRTQADIATV